MNKILLIILIGAVVSFIPVYVCLVAGYGQGQRERRLQQNQISQQNNNPDVYNNEGVIVYADFVKKDHIIVDGCEYVKSGIGYTHKGSCKKCWARMQEMINCTILEKRESITNIVCVTNTVYQTNNIIAFNLF